MDPGQRISTVCFDASFEEVALSHKSPCISHISRLHSTTPPAPTAITCAADLQAAIYFDHVAATYLKDQRSASSFQARDRVVVDVDNDRTDNPAHWVHSKLLAEILSEVSFMTTTSRNHPTAKKSTRRRPRFYVYFPIALCDDANV